MLVLAIIGVGGIYTGTNPVYTAAELTHHIKTSHAKFLISETAILEPLLKAAKQADIPESNLWIFDPVAPEKLSGRRSWRELFDHGEQDWVRFDDFKTSSTSTAARLFSSGTTGLPKAVTMTHYNLIAQQELLYTADPRPYHVSIYEHRRKHIHHILQFEMTCQLANCYSDFAYRRDTHLSCRRCTCNPCRSPRIWAQRVPYETIRPAGVPRREPQVPGL